MTKDEDRTEVNIYYYSNSVADNAPSAFRKYIIVIYENNNNNDIIINGDANR